MAAICKGLRQFAHSWLVLSVSAVMLSAALPRSPRLDGKFIVTAYSVSGETASGQLTHPHVVAADPDILPIGSRIRLRHAGKYSGEYVVADTGQKIVGRKLDLYMPNTVECRKFGKKVLRVKIIEVGDGTHQAAKQADQAVKQDVAADVAKGTVGNAATEADWQKSGSQKPAAAQHPSTTNTQPAVPQP